MRPYYEFNPEKIRIMPDNGPNHFPEHLHSQVEMLYVFSGCSRMLIDGTVHELSAGDLGISFPGVVHGYSGADNADTAMMIFAPELSEDFISLLTRTHPANPVLRANELPEDVPYCIRAVCQERMGEYDPRVLRGYIQVILARIMPRLELLNQPPESSDIAYRILQYLALHFTEPMALTDLSRALGVSESHLSHTFSRRFHTSFRAYINTLRLDHACTLLSNSEASITQILYDCGFESPRTFNRAFAERYGITPSDYRRQQQPL